MIPKISASEYADFLAKEYFSNFLREGGAAVKVAIVPDDETSSGLAEAVNEKAKRLGYCAVNLNAGDNRVHLIQELFFAVAKKLDWVSFAHAIAQQIVVENWGEKFKGVTSVADISAALKIDELIVRTQVQQSLNKCVMQDYSLAKDFRIAMLHVCLPELLLQKYTEESRSAILQWIRGELRLISAVRDKCIFNKIGRHSARSLCGSAARWIAKAGWKGLVITLDIRQVGVVRRSDAGENQHFYTPATAMDVYEVLRQFIDSTDEMRNFMLVVIAPKELLEDTTNRGIQKYQALKNRIWDDVRDKDRVNPFAPMVRISSNGGDQ